MFKLLIRTISNTGAITSHIEEFDNYPDAEIAASSILREGILTFREVVAGTFVTRLYTGIAVAPNAHELIGMPILKTNMSNRTKNALHNGGIVSVDILTRWTRSQLLNLDGVGSGAVDEASLWLERNGLALFRG